MSESAAAQTGIHLKTTFFPLAFMLAFFKPDVSLDGAPPVRVGWGDSFLPAAPGPHRLDVWFEYMFFGAVGKAEGMIQVPDSGVVPVKYTAPFWLVFMSGKLEVQGAAQPALAPGGAPVQPIVHDPHQQAQPVGQQSSAPGDAQWSAEHNAYLHWDAGQQRWLRYDDGSQQWHPMP